MLQIINQHVLQIEDLGFIIDQGQIDNTEGVHHLGVLVKIIEHDIGIDVPAQLDADALAFTVRLIPQVCDAVQPLLFNQISDLLDQSCLINHVRQLCDNNAGLAVGQSLDIGNGPDFDLAAAGPVGFLNAPSAHDLSAGRKIWSLDDLHQFFNIGVPVFFYPVVDDLYNAVDGLPQVMRRDIGCHTNRDTAGTINQQIRESCGEHGRLLLGIIKVGNKINSIFIDIRQHLHGDFAESCLCITHGSSAVAVHRTKVAVAVDQRISGIEILRQFHQSFINGAVTVRMVFTHGIADDTRTLTVGLIRPVIQLNHGVQDSSLNRLKSVSYIRKRSGDDNAHSIINVRGFHGLLQVYVMYLIKHGFIHRIVTPSLNIQILNELGVLFNKRSSGLNLIAHQRSKCQIHGSHIFSIHGNPSQDTLLGIHGGIPELIGIHLAQTLITLDLVAVVSADLIQDGIELVVTVCIPGLLALVDLVKGRLCQIYIALLDQFRHKPVNECKEQGADMGAVHIGIRHQDDLMVTKLADIKIVQNTGTKCRDHCLDLGIAVDSVLSCLLHIQDLAAKGKDGLGCP